MRTFIFFIAVLFSGMIASQNPKTNKRNKIAVDFEHSVSGISAPLILGDFDRTAVYTDSKNDSVFSAEYKRKNDDAQFKFQIIVGYRDEERLFNFYFRNLKERRYTPRETINKTVVFKDGKFRLNGISTYFKHLNRLINVRIYDAGFWMFVSETSQKGNDTLALDTRQNEFLEKIDPSKIVEKNPLTRYTTVYYAKAAFRDSLMMRSTISSSMNKLKWVYDNINKYQRASGIPGNALDYQIAGINGFIDYKSERNPRESKRNDETTKLIGFFTKLRDAGFIDEFLMESYYYLLVPPENNKFDFEDYQKWKLDNSIEYNVFSKYYIIENLYKKTDLSKEED